MWAWRFLHRKTFTYKFNFFFGYRTIKVFYFFILVMLSKFSNKLSQHCSPSCYPFIHSSIFICIPLLIPNIVFAFSLFYLDHLWYRFFNFISFFQEEVFCFAYLLCFIFVFYFSQFSFYLFYFLPSTLLGFIPLFFF